MTLCARGDDTPLPSENRTWHLCPKKKQYENLRQQNDEGWDISLKFKVTQKHSKLESNDFAELRFLRTKVWILWYKKGLNINTVCNIAGIMRKDEGVRCAVNWARATKTNARGNECVIEEAIEPESDIPILHARNVYLSNTLFDLRDYFSAKIDLYSFQVVNYYANVGK